MLYSIYLIPVSTRILAICQDATSFRKYCQGVRKPESLRCSETPGERQWFAPCSWTHDDTELTGSPRNRISDIAAACGFHNLSYFNRRFKERFGETPAEFRRAGSA